MAKALISYFGGKARMIKKLMPYLVAWPHKQYVEVFGGGGSILLSKPPVSVETYNDLNGVLVNFFRVVSSPGQFEEFMRRVALLPCSRELFNEYRDSYEAEEDPIEQAVMWFYCAKLSFGGARAKMTFGASTTKTSSGMSSHVAKYIAVMDRLPEIHRRLQRVQFEHKDWSKILRQYDHPETLFYLDPPYVGNTRAAGGYHFEMTDSDHRRLVNALLEIDGQGILSGYDSPIYKPLEHAGWKKTAWQVSCDAAGRTKNSKLQGAGTASEHAKRQECIWCSPMVSASMVAGLVGSKA